MASRIDGRSLPTLTAGEARRIAIAAQGLAAGSAAPAPGREGLRALARRLGAIQLDSVNVLARSHYLPPFARLGAYARADLEEEAWGATPSLFEYWGHAASLMPVEMQPLFRWRMSRAREKSTFAPFQRGGEHYGYARRMLKEIEARGPVTGGDFAEDRQAPGWWNWSRGKHALEWWFYAGRLTTRTRRNFERVYDLTERALPPSVIDAPTPREPDAHRELLAIAARACGIGTDDDLADYFRLPAREARLRLAELVEEGRLQRVAVDGWTRPAFLAPGARPAAHGAHGALLSPFDSLIWRRERTERMFAVRYRIGIYTPAEQRTHGYYVLPFLQGDALVAQVDLKSDRQAGALLVQAAHLEPGADPGAVAPALAGSLRAMADWLGLPRVRVGRRGAFSARLRRALG